MQFNNPKVNRYDWYIIADPGTSASAFAVNFFAVDAYKPHLFVLDEIYEKQVERTVTDVIGKEIIKKAGEYLIEYEDETPSLWHCYYDAAAAWFAAHFRAQNPDSKLKWIPVTKKPGEKEEGLDTLNSLILNNAITFSKRCGNTIWEFENYARDKNGKLVKRNDHTIDNNRYLIKMAGIVAGVALDKPMRVVRRKAKAIRDYQRPDVKKREGKLNLATRIIKPYDYD